MKQAKPLKQRYWLQYIVVAILFLISISCSEETSLPDSQNDDPLAIEKADFSDALGLWNAPENFDITTEETTLSPEIEEKLLNKRLALVEEESKNLLLASGRTKGELSNLSPEEIFLSALKIYTQQTNNLKNQ